MCLQPLMYILALQGTCTRKSSKNISIMRGTNDRVGQGVRLL